MKLLVKKYPDVNTIALCEEVADDFDASGITGAELLTPVEYQSWLSLQAQQDAVTAINDRLSAESAAREAALQESKISALTATGISRETAIALLNLQTS